MCNSVQCWHTRDMCRYMTKPRNKRHMEAAVAKPTHTVPGQAYGDAVLSE